MAQAFAVLLLYPRSLDECMSWVVQPRSKPVCQFGIRPVRAGAHAETIRQGGELMLPLY